MRWLAFLLLMLAPTAAYADRLAVLELRGSAERDALLMLTNSVRAGAVDGLRGTTIDVMTRENMATLLQDMGIDVDCAEGVCEVETARNLGAQYVLSGEVLRVEGSWVVDLKLHETTGATLLDTREAVGSSQLALREVLKGGAARLVEEGLGLAPSEPRATGALIREESTGFELESAAEHIVAFESEPAGAVVLVAGTLLCAATPCTRRLPEGSLRVEMQRERYVPSRRTVQVVAGMKPVRVVLDATFGWLSADTDPPGLALTLDGSDTDAISERELDPGVYEVLLADERCHLRAGERVVIEAGTRSRVTVPARPREAGLRVDVEDSEHNALEGRVVVDGRDLGAAPGPYRLALCSQTVEVRAEGFGGWSEELQLTEGEVTALRAQLARDGTSATPAQEDGSEYGRGGGFYGKKAGGAPQVTTGDAIVLGAVDKPVIDRIVGQHLAQIRYCYQRELSKDPELLGDIIVKFVIAKDGAVSSASTKKSTMGNPIVEKCVNSRFMRMRFPRPTGGGIAIVSYPFRFEP